MKLVRASLLNLLGLGAPMVVALALIPGLLASLGPQRFGLLALIWAVANYFGMFDLGLARVLTQRMALQLSENRAEEARVLSATALTMLAGLGLFGAVILHSAAPAMVGWVAEVPEPEQAWLALRCMAWALPFLLVTAGLRGMLEAGRAFGTLNLIRLPVGIWTFLGPWWAVERWGPDLVILTQTLVAGRILGCLAHAIAVWWTAPALRGRWTFDFGVARSLIASGGWLTLAAVINPVAAYLDRFIVAGLLSTVAVSHYVTPQELVTKLAILPTSVASVLLPQFATTVLSQIPDRRLFDRALMGIFLLMLPITLGLALWSRTALAAWLGPSFAEESVPVLQILCVGALINSLAYVPLTWLHAQGKFRAPALVQLFALMFFVALLLVLCPRFGIVGAACAWTLRMGGDAMALFWLCGRSRPGERT